MLGLYIFPGMRSPGAVKADPRWARLEATNEGSQKWTMHPTSAGMLVYQPNCSANPADYEPPVTSADGLIYHAPTTLPQLYDLARESIPPATTVTLRRAGVVQVPLGLGPVYGCGRKVGQPSSAYGRMLVELYERVHDEDHEWDASDHALTENVIFEAFAAVYRLTRDLWDELCIYDGDEVDLIIQALQGIDPKASGDGGSTSPQSPQGS